LKKGIKTSDIDKKIKKIYIIDTEKALSRKPHFLVILKNSRNHKIPQAKQKNKIPMYQTKYYK